MRKAVAKILILGTTIPAWASEVPRYDTTPQWVIPAPAIKTNTFNFAQLALWDQQTRIQDGTVWKYTEIGARAVSADALARLGTLTLNWQPFHGDLIIHRVDIVRAGQRFDVLKAGQKFSVLRREQSLNNLEMNGILTATLQVEGLRVDDVLDVAYSVLVKDPSLKGGVQAREFTVSEPFKLEYGRARFLWPVGSGIKWKAYPKDLRATEIEKSGWHEINFYLPAPKQPEMPVDAPDRFKPFSEIEVSSFLDWGAVSSIFAPLYEINGPIASGSPLAQEISKIRNANSDPKSRAAAALSLVQNKIRYFAQDMNGGNYVPQSPERTWSAGYGDCKAKTLLLLAILHDLDVSAEPVLANIGHGDMVAMRLPSPAAFNHIFVHAKIGEEDLWLDGTGRGTKIEDLADPPPFRAILPVRKGGGTIVQLPPKVPARPSRIVSVNIDSTAALGFYAPFTASVVLRGSQADRLRAAASQLDNEKLLELALSKLDGAAGPGAVPVTQHFEFNENSGMATISVTGITSPSWRRLDHSYIYKPVSSIFSFDLKSDRSKMPWKDIPVVTGDASHVVSTTSIQLPEGGYGIALEGNLALDLDVAGRHYARRAALSGELLTIAEHDKNSGEELLPNQLPNVRAKLAAAQEGALRLTTSRTYAPHFKQIEFAKRNHKLDKLESLFAALIASKPDDAVRYISRASFYELSFQRNLALMDLDKAVSLDGSASNLMRRASLLEKLGQTDKAISDYEAALSIVPSSKAAFTKLGFLLIDKGEKEKVLDALQQHLANADEDKPEWMMVEAELIARTGDADRALTVINNAIAIKPTNSKFLNLRCWIKGAFKIQLETAPQDCTKSVELSSGNSEPLNSRALLYIRLNKLMEALSDVNESLGHNPASSESLYLRSLIEKRIGEESRSAADLADARLISPAIDREFAHWKLEGI